MDPDPRIRSTDPDPALSSAADKMTTKNNFFFIRTFLLILFEGSIFIYNSRNQGFTLMDSDPYKIMTDPDSGRPINIWILRIRIHSTDYHSLRVRFLQLPTIA